MLVYTVNAPNWVKIGVDREDADTIENHFYSVQRVKNFGEKKKKVICKIQCIFTNIKNVLQM